MPSVTTKKTPEKEEKEKGNKKEKGKILKKNNNKNQQRNLVRTFVQLYKQLNPVLRLKTTSDSAWNSFGCNTAFSLPVRLGDREVPRCAGPYMHVCRKTPCTVFNTDTNFSAEPGPVTELSEKHGLQAPHPASACKVGHRFCMLCPLQCTFFPIALARNVWGIRTCGMGKLAV